LSARFLATDDYVIRSLEAIERQKKTGSKLFAVFSSPSAYPASHDKIVELFEHMADIMEGELRKLVLVSFVLPERTH
jgi:hypothetical protein